MQFGEWKKRSRAYNRAIVEAEYPLDEKRIESLCRAAFIAGVDWGLETHDAKVGAGRTAYKLHNVKVTGAPAHGD